MVEIILILSALISKVETNTVIVDRFDMVEVNHFYNEWGLEIWCQVIFWDWHKLDKKFHVEHWIMMRDAYKKTPEGEKKHEELIRQIESKYKNINTRTEFRSVSEYRGDFIGGKFYPEKDWKNNIYVVKFQENGVQRRIEAKLFRETHTQTDPEREDKKYYPEVSRRKLKQLPEIIDEDSYFDSIIKTILSQ